jgi:hypothetical protein
VHLSAFLLGEEVLHEFLVHPTELVGDQDEVSAFVLRIRGDLKRPPDRGSYAVPPLAPTVARLRSFLASLSAGAKRTSETTCELKCSMA